MEGERFDDSQARHATAAPISARSRGPSANRAHRLLDAACSGGQIAAVNNEDRGRIEQVEAMWALPRQQRWTLLAERKPRLLRLESEARSGAWGRLPTADPRPGYETGQMKIWPDGRTTAVVRSAREPDNEADDQQLRETSNNALWLHLRLVLLLGPDSRPRDDLLRSTRAQQVGEDYLLRGTK